MNKTTRQENYTKLRRAGFPADVSNVYKDFSPVKVDAIVEVKNAHDLVAGSEIQKIIMARIGK